MNARTSGHRPPARPGPCGNSRLDPVHWRDVAPPEAAQEGPYWMDGALTVQPARQTIPPASQHVQSMQSPTSADATSVITLSARMKPTPGAQLAQVEIAGQPAVVRLQVKAERGGKDQASIVEGWWSSTDLDAVGVVI